MAKNKPDRFTSLAADLASPQVIAAIDKALEENELERIELTELRQMAVRRHGQPHGAPSNWTSKTESIRREVPSEPAANQHTAINTIGDLVRRYETDKDSPFRKIQISSRGGYRRVLTRILADCGDWVLADITAEAFQGLYDGWAKDGHLAMARSLVTMLRMLIKYGAHTLEDRECVRLYLALRKLHLLENKPRKSEPLTKEQVSAFIDKAHEMGFHSIALAQAFQFDCGFVQKDVIGEWVPESEPGESDYLWSVNKWLRGLRWEEIDANRVLRHATSIKRQKEAEIDLKLAATVVKELDRTIAHPSGPIIVSELTGRPYTDAAFRRYWRKIADAAGLPKNIRNTDS